MYYGGRGPQILGVVISFFTLASITVCLRCYVRLRVVKFFGWDDRLMILAMPFYFLFAVCSAISVFYGNGERFSKLTPPDIKTSLQNWWLSQGGYAVACVLAKCSICVFLIRLSVHNSHTYILYGVIAASVVMGLLLCGILLLQCKPLPYFWDKSIDGRCVDITVITAAFYSYSVVNMLADLIISILPIFLIKDMQANKRTKAAIAGILALACLASAAVIFRIPYIKDYAAQDFLHDTAMISICSHLEAGIGICAGCLPTLRPLFRFSGKGTAPSSNRRRSYSQTPAYPSRNTGASRPLQHDSVEGLGKGSNLTESQTRLELDDLECAEYTTADQRIEAHRIH